MTKKYDNEGRLERQTRQEAAQSRRQHVLGVWKLGFPSFVGEEDTVGRLTDVVLALQGLSPSHGYVPEQKACVWCCIPSPTLSGPLLGTNTRS